MSRILVAATLAIVIMAAPAMAQELTSPWNPDVEINVEVAAMGELWHGANELNLAVHDGAAWFGQTVNMNMLGNVDFDVYLAVNGTLPADVFVEIVTNENGKWAERAADFGEEAYQRYDPRGFGDARLEGLVHDTKESHYFSHITGDLAAQKIWSFAASPSAQSISNLYTVWAGNVAPAFEENGSVTVEYTMTATNG